MIKYINLINKILYLIPDAKVSVVKEKPKDNFLNETIHSRDGLYVIWNNTNTQEIPTQAELDSVDQVDANNAELARQKTARNSLYKKDLTVKAGYQIALKDNPNLTFSDYLDKLENL